MTTLYFVRHAEPDYEDHDDRTRPLSARGWRDRARVAAFLEDKGVDAVLSSPYRRAVDTVSGFAEAKGLEIAFVEDFRERSVGAWVEDFAAYSRAQWADFDYKLPGGESLREVQERNLSALGRVRAEYGGRTVTVGSHGTALSTLVHFYDPSFGYAGFERIRDVMPWIVKFVFDGDACVELASYERFGT